MLLDRSLLSVVLFLATAMQAAPTPSRVQGEVLVNRAAAPKPAPEPELEASEGGPKEALIDRIPAHMIVHRVAKDNDLTFGAPQAPGDGRQSGHSAHLIDRAAAPEPGPKSDDKPPDDDLGPVVSLIKHTPDRMLVDRVAESLPGNSGRVGNHAPKQHRLPAVRRLTGWLMGRAIAPAPASVPVPGPFPDDLSGPAAVLRTD